MDTTVLIIAVASALGGLVLGRLLMGIKANNIIKVANAKAKAIQRKAHQQGDSLKKDKILQAKERFLELKGEHEKVILQREKKILEVENRVKDKEAKLNNELNRTKSLSKNLEDKSATLNLKLEKLEGQKRTLDQQLEQQIQKLEELSGYSAEQAKEELVQSLKDRANSSAMSYLQTQLEEAKLTVDQEAKKLIVSTIQRIGTEEAVENCVSVFNLESDDMKGRIIGREGRNIRTGSRNRGRVYCR